MRIFLIFLMGLLGISASAQTPEKPVTHSELPSGWKGPYDITADNNGLFKLGFMRVLKGDSGFGFLYEGGEVTVEQTTKSLDDWKREMYGHMNGTGREDSYQACRCTRLGDGPTRIGGYSAYFIGELQRCYLKNDGKFDDEDVVRAYYVQVGKAAYYIYTESDSETEGGTTEYEAEIDRILAGFRFFGSNGGGSSPSNQNTNENTIGGNENPPQITSSDDDISIGDVVIGAVIGGGVAGLAGWAIKSALGKRNPSNNSPQNQQKQPQPKPKNNPKPAPKTPKNTGSKRKEEEQKPEEKEDEEKEDENSRYILELSQQNLELSVGESAEIRISVWKIDSKGRQSLAAEAPIETRSNSSALIATPSEGQGAILLHINLKNQPENEKLSIDVGTKAGGKIMRTQITIHTHKNNDEYEFISTQVPPDKQYLQPDGQDVLYFYVQVRNKSNDRDPNIGQLNQKIKISSAANDNGWLNLGEQQLIDGWQAVGFSASDPQPHLAGPNIAPRPPKQVGLLASVTLPNGKVLQQSFDFPLAQPAILDVDNDSLYFPALPISIDLRHQHHIDIIAFIDAPEAGEKWNFAAAYENRKLTELEIIPRNDSQAVIRLKTPSASLEAGQSEIFGHLIISAQSEKRKAFNQRQVNVSLRAEGIFAVKGLKNGQLQISGQPEDKATKAEFALFVWDEERQEMRADGQAIADLQFDFGTPNSSDRRAQNLLSVAKINPQFESTISDNHGIFSFAVQNEIPGQDELLGFGLRVYCRSEINKKDYELNIPAGILAQGIGPSSEDWQREYQNCLTYIEKHVPASHKADMLRLVEEQKMRLGHEGLYHLRHKIHSVAQNLILAEGAEGYRSAEKWYTDVIELLEWCEWAGNLAFNVVSATLFGPYAPAVSIAKSYGIQALQYVLEGKTLEQWVYDSFTLHTLFKAAEGRLIDTDRIAEYFKSDGTVKAYAKAWAIFIGYHFAYNVFWEKRSVVEALKQVAREIRDEAIVTFFQRRLKAEADAGKDQMEPITDPIRQLRQGFVARANGQHECRLQDVLNCMRDPQAMRTLKKASPELQDAFNRTREALYKNHDDTVKNQLSQKLGIPADDLRIDDFRTPGGAGSNINTDRDYRMLYRAGKDANGNDIWFEVPKEKWQNISYETFGQLTNKPPHLSDLEWAQQHLQLATDKAHIEASPDYSDHAVNPQTGQKEIIRPNIIAVEEGKSRLFDSTALGNMYHEKVHASLRMNQLSEAIAQCKKGVDTLDKVRNGYQMQDLNVGNLPKSIQDGMQIVKNAPTDKGATPEVMQKFNQDLNNAGFRSLEDFSNKLASQFESLKKYDQQPAAHHFASNNAAPTD